MTTGSLMGYPQTSNTVVGNTDAGFVYDGRFGNFYGVDTADGATSGLRKWDAWPQGLERRARNIGDLGHSVTVYQQQTITYGSQELIVSAGASNTAPLFGFSLADLSFTGVFGVTSSSLANSSALRILATGQIVAILDNVGRDVVVSRTLLSGASTGGCEINCIEWGGKVNTKSNITENFAVLGAVPDGSGKVAYALGYNGGTAAMHLYSISGTVVSNAIAALTVAQIDPTWTNVVAVYGITVDQTDGNLILGFSTTDVVTHAARLVKLNSSTGALMWSTAVGGASGIIEYNVNDMSKSVVKNGVLYYIGSDANTLWTINTLTGAATSQTFDNGSPDVLHGHQMSEDVSGSIMWYGGWVEGATHPAYIGNFCGTLGNHTGSHMGWRFWPTLNPITSPPAYAAPATSRKRAWFFVLDGHEMYVLDMGQQGSWIYDRTTGQWCQFVTNGYVQWNFANGVMWGQRIIAGDLLTTDVWEMSPSQLFDNGSTEIQHVVTGGVATRNRTYHSVDSFILACSSGLYTDATGAATVTLSFSDDQGNTFTTMDTFTLPAGAFSQVIQWTSLGSFASPGRIFRITDSGAFLRIDGADAGIDGFDPITGDPGDQGGNAQ